MTASGKQERRYWGTVMPAHADIITAMAKQAEEQGLEGVFAPQVWGPPFTALAVAAAATKEIKIASGIAIAAARSPFETAVTALDLDRISDGRFILGLGTSVAAITTGMFGAPEIKPLAHMRETIAAIKHIISGASKGLEPFEGQYFSSYATSLAPMGPPLRETIPRAERGSGGATASGAGITSSGQRRSLFSSGTGPPETPARISREAAPCRS